LAARPNGPGQDLLGQLSETPDARQGVGPHGSDRLFPGRRCGKGLGQPPKTSGLSYEGVSDFLRKLAVNPEGEEREKILEQLGDAYPQCLPHVLRIARQAKHPASVRAIAMLAWKPLGKHEA
jgi:hypothetical protein